MLRRNMTSAECQISDPKGRYLVFTLLFFQMPMMKTQGLNTKIITKKPKSARNCESRARAIGLGRRLSVALIDNSFWQQTDNINLTTSRSNGQTQMNTSVSFELKIAGILKTN